jgi:hypothetical protein
MISAPASISYWREAHKNGGLPVKKGRRVFPKGFFDQKLACAAISCGSNRDAACGVINWAPLYCI